MDLTSSKILVTGGASGMGKAFVMNLAKDGADVAFCDLNEEAIKAVEAEAADLPGKVVGFIANVASEDEFSRLVNQAETVLVISDFVNEFQWQRNRA